jgi:hypothetical protein
MPHSTHPGATAAPAPSPDLSSPEFTSELLAAIAADYELEEYLSARAAGIGHQELIDLDLPPYRTPSDYIAARCAGATPAEIAQVLAVSHHRWGVISLDEYASGRAAGATHAALLDAHDHGVDTHSYGVGHAAGATHAELIAMCDYSGHYSQARQTGATHQDMLDSQVTGVDVAIYVVLRKSGVTHNEAIAAQQAPQRDGIGLGWYLEAQQRGHTHEEAMDLMAAHLKS